MKDKIITVSILMFLFSCSLDIKQPESFKGVISAKMVIHHTFNPDELFIYVETVNGKKKVVFTVDSKYRDVFAILDEGDSVSIDKFYLVHGRYLAHRNGTSIIEKLN